MPLWGLSPVVTESAPIYLTNMKIRSIFGLFQRVVWLVGLATTLRRVWRIVEPAKLSRSQEKQRRKQLVAEAQKRRGRSQQATA